MITNREEGKGKPPRSFTKTGYPLGYPEPALQQKTEERERDFLSLLLLLYVCVCAAAASRPSANDNSAPTAAGCGSGVARPTTDAARCKHGDQHPSTDAVITTTTTTDRTDPTESASRGSRFPGDGAVSPPAVARTLHVATECAPYNAVGDRAVTADRRSAAGGVQSGSGVAGDPAARGIRTQSGPVGTERRRDVAGPSRRRRDASDAAGSTVTLRRTALATNRRKNLRGKIPQHRKFRSGKSRSVGCSVEGKCPARWACSVGTPAVNVYDV